MAKFKKGDKVTLNDDLCVYAKPGDVLTVTSTDEEFTYFTNAHGQRCFHSTGKFELIEGGTMNFKVGDVLVDGFDSELTVLAYINQGVELYLLSKMNQPNVTGAWWTAQELKESDWKLKTEPTTVEKSVADIEKELGLTTGTLRIKKED